MGATESLEQQASAARDKLVHDSRALRAASSASIESLTAHREMLTASLISEIRNIETDTTFSLSMLQAQLAQTVEEKDALEDSLTDHGKRLATELAELKRTHAEYVAAAAASAGGGTSCSSRSP